MELRCTGSRHKGRLWTIVTKCHNVQRIKDFSSIHMKLYKYLIWVTNLYMPKIDWPLLISKTDCQLPIIQSPTQKKVGMDLVVKLQIL